MHPIFANQTASISELKRNPTALLKQANGQHIAILNHNKPSGYLVPVETYERMIDVIEDFELGKIVEARKNQIPDAVEVTLEALLTDDF